jgi:hypothetical protein
MTHGILKDEKGNTASSEGVSCENGKEVPFDELSRVDQLALGAFTVITKVTGAIPVDNEVFDPMCQQDLPKKPTSRER